MERAVVCAARTAPVRAPDPPLAGCTVIVVGDGERADVAAILAGGGAVVRDVRVAERAGTRGTERLSDIVIGAARGDADAMLFVSDAAAASWAEAAEQTGSLGRVRRRVETGRLLVVVGDSSGAAAMDRVQIRSTIAHADHAGAFARPVIEHFEGGGAPTLPTDSGWIQVRSRGVVIDDGFIPLTRSATALIDALAAAGGSVLSRSELGDVLPGAERTAHAVEVAVARLREALGERALVHTVVKRGYRLAVTDG